MTSFKNMKCLQIKLVLTYSKC